MNHSLVEKAANERPFMTPERLRRVSFCVVRNKINLALSRQGIESSWRLNSFDLRFFRTTQNETRLSPNHCHWQIAKVKNYNFNVTEARNSDFKKCFSRNFQFHRRDPNQNLLQFDSEWVDLDPISFSADKIQNHKVFIRASHKVNIFFM